jgi:hypothetical protein
MTFPWQILLILGIKEILQFSGMAYLAIHKEFKEIIAKSKEKMRNNHSFLKNPSDSEFME